MLPMAPRRHIAQSLLCTKFHNKIRPASNFDEIIRESTIVSAIPPKYSQIAKAQQHLSSPAT
jgi:hypothetical protein